MPTYDYECRACGTRFEVIHSMLEEGPETCERCGGQLRRILYPTGIIFKGSGFYATDSRAAAESSTAARDKSAGDDKGAGDTGSKPEPSKGAGGSESPSTPSAGGGTPADSAS